MDKFIKELFSMKIMIALMLFFAISCACATFIEKIYDTQTAWAVVYASSWFAFIQIWLGANLVVNLFKYNLFRREKIPALIFHLSFLFILFGAAITRYFGFEALMHIRNGDTQNQVYTQNSYIEISTKKDDKQYISGQGFMFSKIGKNKFSLSMDISEQKVKVDLNKILNNAQKEYVEDKNGQAVIVLVVSAGTPKEITLKENTKESVNGVAFEFIKDEKEVKNNPNTVYFFIKDNKFYMSSMTNISWYKMSENKSGKYDNKINEFIPNQLYNVENLSFAPRKILLKATEKLVEKEIDSHSMMNNPLALFDVSFNGEKKEVALEIVPSGTPIEKTEFTVGGQVFQIGYGARVFELPFAIKLKKFVLDRYPGSQTPMSYASEIVVMPKDSKEFDYRIFMNHVLDFKGYRFFQSSYDRDEKGTILSVNKDPGKFPTYFGYFLLILGLILNVLNTKSRFRKLAALVNKDSMQNLKSLALISILSIFLHQGLNADDLGLDKIDKKTADNFSTILTQGFDGRVKPLNTLAVEVLNKIHKKSSYKSKSANEVFLSMIMYSNAWRNEPFIYVKNDKLKEILGLEKHQKYAKFTDFFSENSEYKIAQFAEMANRKNPTTRNQFDKEVLNADERLNISFYIFSTELLKIFPKKGAENFKWYSLMHAMRSFPDDEQQKVIVPFYNILKSVEAQSWNEANDNINIIKAYQKEVTPDIIPSDTKIQAEILFNKYNIFENLTPAYLLAGFFLLMVIFAKMAKPTLNIKSTFKISYIVVLIAFVSHTLGLALRWYVAEHAPWSNSYESMIYISWALSLSGIIFAKKSPVSLALTSILTAVTLFSAHLSWMNPQITTIVPVLNSYWLTIHVSVITASYGFLGLCAMLGIFVQILFILRNPKRKDTRSLEIDRNILEATRINEMSMILGLSLLIAGNFIGGVWANESWGRYWGWDAKETWALISILVYAAIVHFRFISALNSQYAFAVASSFGYWVIMMTYFGVNFYLAGMHSYAAGDSVPIPNFILISFIIMLMIFIFSFFKKNLSRKL